MSICFNFILGTSKSISSVLILGKEYYPTTSLIEVMIISKIYNLTLNILLKLISSTSTPLLCVVGVCNIYVFKTTEWR